MSSLFGEVWFWSLLAFLVGALLTWVLLFRPERHRNKQLEQRSRQLERPRQQQAAAPPPPPVEPRYHQPSAGEWPAAPEAPVEPVEPQPRTQWLEQDSLPRRDTVSYPEDVQVEELSEGPADNDFASAYADDYPESGGYPSRTTYADDFADSYPEERRYEPSSPADEPATSGLADLGLADRLEAEPQGTGFDALDEPPAVTERVEPEEALPTQRVRPEAFTAAAPAIEPEAFTAAAPVVEPEVEEYTQRVSPPEPAQAEVPERTESGFFEEEQPTQAVEPDGQLPDIEPDFDPATGLPKRTRGASSNRIRGGFEPPKPIQPSVRPIARRTPSDTTVATGGSLFEPGAAEAAQHAPPARSTSAQTVPPGPFGPGSAMPLPGGGRPDPGFTVKGSVTALRYCPEDSPRFGEMVAEVWFASVADAERVGFRPLS